MEEELDRLNHELAEVAWQLDRAASPDDRRAVAQVAGLALAKTLALAQWLADGGARRPARRWHEPV